MLRTFVLSDGKLRPVPPDGAPADLPVWFDLILPTRDEEIALETRLGIELPTRDEMQEIELSSRLYTENGASYMTALVPSHTDGDDILLAPITFILAAHRLVTIRYHEPRTFTTFSQRAERNELGLESGESVLLGLLETIVDRLADILERAGRDLDAISRHVFAQGGAEARKGTSYKGTLEEIGRKGDLSSNIRESLATIERLGAYLGPTLRDSDKARREQLNAIASDVRSLTDHSEYMAQKITFLLDATLGLISIEQNATIKIFSVVAVVFLPPTLVASVYGMNFDVMPELHWQFGYPLAIGAMILSAILPYLYFKHRGWL